MEKLILEYSWGGEPCSGTSQVCFEYESKDKFVFDVLEKFKDHPWREETKNWYYPEEVELFKDGPTLTKYDIENIERMVYTPQEWFEENKIGFLL